MKKYIILLLISIIVLSSCTEQKDDIVQKKDANIDVAFTVSNINPLSYNTDMQRILPNVFEALVGFDNLMRIKPAIAVSWGNIDEYTWEFKIRDDVYFHDGTKMTMKDIIDTLDFVKSKDFLSIHIYAKDIDSVSQNGDKLIIKTKQKDPILLQKLTNIFIVPSTQITSKDVRIGSGKYKIGDILSDRIILQKFDKHYNHDDILYEKVNISFVEDRNKRYDDIVNNKIDLLADVPVDFISDIERAIKEGSQNVSKLEIIESSSLDTIFIIYNAYDTGKNLLINKDLRILLTKLIDRKKIINFIGDRFVSVSNQFINSNTVGFDPMMEKQMASQDITLEDSKKQLQNILGDNMLLMLNLVSTNTMSVLAQNIQQQLLKHDIQLNLQNVDEKKLLQIINDKTDNMYLIGWRFDLLDAIDFLYAIAKYAGIPDDNPLYDDIDGAAQVMDTTVRIEKIKNIIQKVIQEYSIGAPLFESKNVYIKQNDFKWTPRPDNALIF